MLKAIYRTSPLLLVFLLASVAPSKAQSLSVFFGVGSATDSSNGNSYDFTSSTGCYTGDPTCFAAPGLGGAFGSFGAQFMLNHHLGFDGEYAFRFSQEDYAVLGMRPTFYDFNAVYQLTDRWTRVVPVVEGGIGGATMHFYVNQAYCVVSCQNYSYPYENSNHFQIHAAVGLKLYVKGNIFIRPQFDLHYVPNLVEFGSDVVPQYTVAIGYTFGGR